MYTYIEVDPEEYEHSIIAMFNNCFGRSITSEQFKWKYLDTKPEKMRTWAAFEKATDSPVAFYSAFKVNFLYQRKTLIAYQASDAMVLKEHRRHGLYSSLSLHVKRKVIEDGAKLFIGYANEKSFPALMKISQYHKEMCSSYVYFFPIGAKNIVNRLNINVHARRIFGSIATFGLRIVRRCSFPWHKTSISLQEVDDLGFVDELDTADLQSYHLLFPVRTSQYYLWKTKLAPRQVQEKLHMLSAFHGDACVGVCVLSNDTSRNVLLIRSILCTEPSFLNDLVIEIIRYAIRNDYDGVLTNCASELYQANYRKLGFIRGNRVLGVLTDLKGEFHSKLKRTDFILLEPIDRDLFD